MIPSHRPISFYDEIDVVLSTAVKRRGASSFAGGLNVAKPLDLDQHFASAR